MSAPIKFNNNNVVSEKYVDFKDKYETDERFQLLALYGIRYFEII